MQKSPVKSLYLLLGTSPRRASELVTRNIAFSLPGGTFLDPLQIKYARTLSFFKVLGCSLNIVAALVTSLLSIFLLVEITAKNICKIKQKRFQCYAFPSQRFFLPRQQISLTRKHPRDFCCRSLTALIDNPVTKPLASDIISVGCELFLFPRFVNSFLIED